MEKKESWITFMSGMALSALLFFLFGEEIVKYKDADVAVPSEESGQQEGNVTENTNTQGNSDLAGEEAEVKFVVDGDTLVLKDGTKIRLLGIDTPERGEHYYDEATDHLKKLVEGKVLRLERDVSETDRYGRSLRHIYVDDVWINAQMIEEGYAKIVTYPPDVSHVKEFKELQREALANKSGLWQNKNN